MVKSASFYAVSVVIVASFMLGGCANKDIVKKDDAITPAAVTKPVDQPKSREANPGVAPQKQVALPPTATTGSTPAAGQQSQTTPSLAELQAALATIYFDFDSSNLSEASRSALAKDAALFSKQSAPAIRIEGNCDERGSAEYNLALGERRAKAAQQYLLTMGVKPERLSIVSYGKEKPAVTGSDEAAWSKNRRDEFVVIK